MAEGPEHDQRMPLTDHLSELRRRLVWCVLAWVGLTMVSFSYADSIIAFLMVPLDQAAAATGVPSKLHFTSITEPLFQSFKVAVYSGAFFSFPIIAWHGYAFTAPGLYRKEKRIAVPFMLAACLLFPVGGAFAYTVAIPLAYRVLLSYSKKGAEKAAKKDAKKCAKAPCGAGRGLKVEILPVASPKVGAPGPGKPTARITLRRTKWGGASIVLSLPQPKRTLPGPASRPAKGGGPARREKPAQPGKAGKGARPVPTPAKAGLKDLAPLARLFFPSGDLWLAVERHGKTAWYRVRTTRPGGRGKVKRGGLEPILTIKAYISTSSVLLLAFASIFEIPLVIVLLVFFGVVDVQFFRKYRRHAVVLTVIAAAVLTPTGDPVNLAVMAVPMYALFELGLLVASVVGRGRKLDEAEDEVEP